MKLILFVLGFLVASSPTFGASLSVALGKNSNVNVHFAGYALEKPSVAKDLFSRRPDLVKFLDIYNGSEVAFVKEGFEFRVGDLGAFIKFPSKDLLASGSDLVSKTRFVNFTGDSAQILYDIIVDEYSAPFRYPGQNFERIIDFGGQQLIICTDPTSPLNQKNYSKVQF